MKVFTKLTLQILLFSILLGCTTDVGEKKKVTIFNVEYNQKRLEQSKALQETAWGFQEILLNEKVEHHISSISEYKVLIRDNKRFNNGELQWKDNKVHIIHFEEGEYIVPKGNSYYVLLVPSETIIEGAGIGKTKFIVRDEIAREDTFHFRRVFNLEYASHDVVVRGMSFYNETKDNKWGFIHSNGRINRENYLFENIEFDDAFGEIGNKNYTSNFITFRGLRKRIGTTSSRIRDNFTIPVPGGYQFTANNSDNVQLSGQIGVRPGNSVVFHDCVLGDNVSATIDIYSNYVEMVGIKFINPLHDHSIKNPRGNHLYIHDSSFNLTYTQKLIEGTGYWNPTFFTHENTAEVGISLRKNYHFKNLTFKRVSQNITALKNGTEVTLIESEPFSIYDEEPIRQNNVSGDMVWESIIFDGYSIAHQIVGYPNVNTSEGYEALNYTSFTASPAQMKSGNNNLHGSYGVYVEDRQQSHSKEDKTGVYSWGQRSNGSIDYPRENRLFIGSKENSIQQPYIQMQTSLVKDKYNQLLY